MEPGDLVLSMSGRDKDRYFIVMNIEDEFCFLADGDLRKSDKPKKKKVKHILRTGYGSEFIKQKFSEEQKVTNTELRTEIKKFINSLNPSENPVE